MGISFSKAFGKDKAKSGAKSESDFNYDNNHRFYKFYKGYDEFEDMSLDSKYSRMKKKIINVLLTLKILDRKIPKQLKKEGIMKDGDELYKKYYDVYKSDHDTDDELNEVKKKKMDYKQFELFDKTDKKLKLDEETKNFVK